MFMSAAQYKQFRQKGTRKVASGTRAVLTENEIQNEIRERLRWAGWYVIRHQQSMGSLKGLSDLSAIRNGQTVYIEVKKPGGVQSQYQKDFQAEVESHGARYILAYSVDDVDKLVDECPIHRETN